MALKLPPAEAANVAIQSIGCGYDLSLDLSLKYRKRRYHSDFGSNPYRNCRLIEIEEVRGRDIVVPGGHLVLNVSRSIKCIEGKPRRIQSDSLSFHQMSEQFNREMSLTPRTPSGFFNAMFEFSGIWSKDASSTKTLAFDGVVTSLYTVELEKYQIVLCDYVKKAVPSTWEPALLARFIEKFGTHIIVGVEMGGKDVIYMKQQHGSSLEPADVQKKFKAMADNRFLDSNGQIFIDSEHSSQNGKDLVSIFTRRGGSYDRNLKHKEWLHSVQLEPDVIRMSFIPITSLLNGFPGKGYLNHAIDLYLKYKPPIEELHRFLEFQKQRDWTPFHSDIPEQIIRASLQFSFSGPKIYVKTNPVDVGKRLVTGLQLNHDGYRPDCLAIYLQYLVSLPNFIQIEDSVPGNFNSDSNDSKYYKKVESWYLSHVCTAPVESEDEFSIVTGAQLQVRDEGYKKVLFLRLRFSKLVGCTLNRNPEWDGSPVQSLISHQVLKPQPPPLVRDINMGKYPQLHPDLVLKRTLLKYVDTTQMMRGPEDAPGYWVVSGARLVVDKGKISLGIKYSLPIYEVN